MSKQVTISDTFYDDLAESIRAAIEYAQNPTRPDAGYHYLMRSGIYEYDTEIWAVINRVVSELVPMDEEGEDKFDLEGGSHVYAP